MSKNKQIRKVKGKKKLSKKGKLINKRTEKPIELNPIVEYKNICKKCGAKNTLYPHFLGNKRGYRCESCGQLSTGVTKKRYDQLKKKEKRKRINKFL